MSATQLKVVTAEGGQRYTAVQGRCTVDSNVSWRASAFLEQRYENSLEIRS